MGNFGHSDDFPPAPRSLEDALMKGALDAMVAGDFKRGRQLFAHLRGLGVRSQGVLLGLAVCADQSGDDVTAKSTLDEAATLAASGDPLCREIHDAVRPWLPGGQRSHVSASELSAVACRFIATL